LERLINHILRPVKCILNVVAKRKPIATADQKEKIDPIPIRNLRENVNLIEKLDSPEVKAEISRLKNIHALRVLRIDGRRIG
jgi:hypothetical protein